MRILKDSASTIRHTVGSSRSALACSHVNSSEDRSDKNTSSMVLANLGEERNLGVSRECVREGEKWGDLMYSLAGRI